MPGKKLYEDKGKLAVVDEGPMDDPVAEKLRQQKCAPSLPGVQNEDCTVNGCLLE